MKTKAKTQLSRLIAVGGFSFVFVGTVSVSSATDYTWNSGTAGTASLSDSTKWLAPNGAIPATGATDAILTFAAPQLANTTLTVTNNLAGTLVLNRLNFNNSNDSGTAPTLNLSGNDLRFVTNVATAPYLSLSPAGTTPGSRPKIVISNNITLDNDLTLSQPNASHSATLSGIISGIGGLGKTSGAGSVTISNTANSFSGPVTISANGSLSVPMVGNATSNSPLGTSSGITLGGGSNSGQLTFTGNSETTNKVFTLGGAAGGGTISVSTANQTLTITPDIVGGTDISLRTLTLAGNGNVTLPGSIGAGIGNALGVTKSGTGTATLTGTSGSFNGVVTVSAGTLAATSIGNIGSNSSLGTNATINLGGTTNAGTLRFLGTTAETTDKTINMSGTTGGATITTRDAVLTISADLAMAGSGNKTLALSSSTNTSGVNFNGLLADVNGTLSLRVNGSGTGNNSLGNTNNSFTGSVTIDGNIIAKTTTLEVALIGNSGSNSSLGTNGTIRLGSAVADSNNILKYSGVGEDTDKVINLVGTGGNGGLEQSAASGLLKFTSALTPTGIGSKTLILSGSSAGTGEFSGAIPDNSTTGTTSLASTFAVSATTVTLASVDGITVGASISGTGIAAGTTVSAINTGTRVVTLSAATTALNNTLGSSYTVAGVKNITSLAKYGTGTWTLSGANTYTGATNVAAGTLALAATGSINTSSGVTIGAGATLDTTAQASFTLPGAKVYIFAVDSASTGTAGQIKAADLNIATANTALTLVNPTLDDAVYVIATYTGTLTGTFATAAPAGYSWNYGTGTNSQITLVQDVAGYASWNTSNAGGQDPSLDWDNDGVSNGVEFFMNAPAGITANPAMGPGNTISWTNGGNIPSSAYGTQYIVQTSSDLVTWADVLVENLTANTNSLLTYTLTGSGPRFVRLKVTPN